jgi:hypothetical protein
MQAGLDVDLGPDPRRAEVKAADDGLWWPGSGRAGVVDALHGGVKWVQCFAGPGAPGNRCSASLKKPIRQKVHAVR